MFRFCDFFHLFFCSSPRVLLLRCANVFLLLNSINIHLMFLFVPNCKRAALSQIMQSDETSISGTNVRKSTKYSTCTQNTLSMCATDYKIYKTLYSSVGKHYIGLRRNFIVLHFLPHHTIPYNTIFGHKMYLHFFSPFLVDCILPLFRITRIPNINHKEHKRPVKHT